VSWKVSVSEEPKKEIINYQLKAESWCVGEQHREKRPRKPSLRRTIAAAEKATGKVVTSISTADGTTLHFGADGSAATNEWDEVCRVKN
jgi:hypothetical protein